VMEYQTLPYTTRPEWLKLRRIGLGASDIAAVIGISPWSTPHQVWVSKTTPDAPEPLTNEDMEWGLRVESLIIEEASTRLGMTFKRGLLVQNKQRPWMLATLDGLHAGDRKGVILEAKKVDAWDWPDGPPPYYLSQVQWQMAVTGYTVAHIAALHRGRRLELYPVTADREAQEALIEAGAGFWQSVLAVEPPPVTAEDSTFLNQLWPTHQEAAVEIPEELAAELRAAKAAEGAAKKRLDLAAAQVKELLEDADTATVGDDVVATWRTSTTERVDVKALRAEEPDIAATYSRKSSSRRFLIKGA
jgi:putative phage-type endonuclease